jgi:phosphoenolpyruvate synthase/pyruvate phosphate dikinase
LKLVEQRKEEYEHFKKLNAPRVLTSEGEEIKVILKRENLPEGALAGIPVSSGVIEGIAKVIIDPSKDSLSKGEILIAPFTDPGWTPLFINAAGLVMEVGGQLTHGTIVAREYGIPAVVGVSEATKKIKTGQKIRVDGNAGFVMIIEE